LDQYDECQHGECRCAECRGALERRNNANFIRTSDLVTKTGTTAGDNPINVFAAVIYIFS
jgi:hypothetical protein